MVPQHDTAGIFGNAALFNMRYVGTASPRCKLRENLELG